VELSGLGRLCTAWVSWFELSCVLSTWWFNCCGLSWTCSASFSGFDPLRARLSPPRCLTCSWACRMSSGPWGIVVVCLSWPGHPTWIKKKKKKTRISVVVLQLYTCFDKAGCPPEWWTDGSGTSSAGLPRYRIGLIVNIIKELILF
jgi:hypothetical protein